MLMITEGGTLRTKNLVSKAVVMFAAAVVAIIGSGCGTVHHELVLQKDYEPKAGATIEVGKVSNDTGKTFDIEIDSMLRDALVNAFLAEGMNAANGAPKLMTTCRILTYEKGDAFKRWLMPGWGSTELAIQCDLQDANSTVGNINAKRTVDGGGAYTIGAWKNVFLHVASDVAQDVRERFNGPRVQ